MGKSTLNYRKHIYNFLTDQRHIREDLVWSKLLDYEMNDLTPDLLIIAFEQLESLGTCEDLFLTTDIHNLLRIEGHI